MLYIRLNDNDREIEFCNYYKTDTSCIIKFFNCDTIELMNFFGDGVIPFFYAVNKDTGTEEYVSLNMKMTKYNTESGSIKNKSYKIIKESYFEEEVLINYETGEPLLDDSGNKMINRVFHPAILEPVEEIVDGTFINIILEKQNIHEKVNDIKNVLKENTNDVKHLKENGCSPNAYNSVLNLAKAMASEITDDTVAITIQELYDDWSGKSVYYEKGIYLRFEKVLYKVIINHTSQENWTPLNAPSLYAKVLTDVSGVILPWEQPDSTNGFKTGDKVTHKGKTWISTADENIWEPGAVGAPWEEVEG